ncbi:MAG: LiaI-LiaF-like domain-containing protein [Candidatus Krumholzibacteriia bacterium]
MSTSTPGAGRMFAALLLILIGTLFLLDNLDIADVGDFFEWFFVWWPLLIIALGVKALVLDRALAGGMFLTGIGVVLLLLMLGHLDWSLLGTWWPLFLIGLGVSWLLRSRGGRGGHAGANAESLRMTAFLAGRESVVRSSSFRRAEVTGVLGGVDLDLRPARLHPDGAEIEATALLGGVEIRAPQPWNVELCGTPLFGSCEDRRRIGTGAGETAPPTASAPTLRVKSTVLFGSVEVKD